MLCCGDRLEAPPLVGGASAAALAEEEDTKSVMEI